MSPFYLPGTKYLIPNKTISYKINQSFSPNNLSEFLRFNVNKITAYRKVGFSMNLSINLIRERKTGEGEYDFHLGLFSLPKEDSRANKNYFRGYLVDNNGNFYLVVPQKFSENFLLVNIGSKKIKPLSLILK